MIIPVLIYFQCPSCKKVQGHAKGLEIVTCIGCSEKIIAPDRSQFRIDHCPGCGGTSTRCNASRGNMVFTMLMIPLIFPFLYLVTLPMFVLGWLKTAPGCKTMECKVCGVQWYSRKRGLLITGQKSLEGHHQAQGG
jgi:hypothetical protein